MEGMNCSVTARRSLIKGYKMVGVGVGEGCEAGCRMAWCCSHIDVAMIVTLLLGFSLLVLVKFVRPLAV